MSGLFDRQRADHLEKAQPLAARMRPRTIDEFVGQQHFLGAGKLLRRMLAADRLSSLVFYGPRDHAMLVLAFVLYGVGLNGLVTSLGGLFAVDIAPKRVAGAALGFVGIFSYIGAAIQEQVSGALIESGMRMVDGVRVYDFEPAILFWMGSSALSLLLAASLWRVRLRD